MYISAELLFSMFENIQKLYYDLIKFKMSHFVYVMSNKHLDYINVTAQL